MMFLMVYLYTALEMMQNSLRTSGIGCESMEMRLWCMLFYFVNFVDENDVVGENSFASDVIWTANEFRSAFDVGEFEVNVFAVLQTHVHAFFNTNSN